MSNVNKNIPILITTPENKRIVISDCFIDYLDMLADILDIKRYSEFQDMDDYKSYIRDMKINKVLNNI